MGADSRTVRILAAATFAAVVGFTLRLVPARNASSAAVAPRRSFVCITGQLERLELENKVATVLEPLRRAGYEPDIALVLADAAGSFTTNTRNVDFQYIPPFDSVGEAAGYLRGLGFAVISDDEPYNQVADPILNDDYVNQLDHHGHGLTMVRSKNNIRMLETWAQCYREMAKNIDRAMKYDMVVRIREDVGFLEVLDIGNVLEDLATDPKTVISNGCRLEYGMNDKFAFASMDAARSYFMSPFEDYYTKPLDKHAKSSESFIYYTYKAEGLNVIHSPTIRHVVKLLSDADGRTYLFPKEPSQLSKHCNIEVVEVGALNTCRATWHASRKHQLETKKHVCWQYKYLQGDPSR